MLLIIFLDIYLDAFFLYKLKAKHDKSIHPAKRFSHVDYES